MLDGSISSVPTLFSRFKIRILYSLGSDFSYASSSSISLSDDPPDSESACMNPLRKTYFQLSLSDHPHERDSHDYSRNDCPAAALAMSKVLPKAVAFAMVRMILQAW